MCKNFQELLVISAIPRSALFKAALCKALVYTIFFNEELILSPEDMCSNAVTHCIRTPSANNCYNAPRKISEFYDKEICMKSKNLFGTQVSMLNDTTAISCAFQEMIESKWVYYEFDRFYKLKSWNWVSQIHSQGTIFWVLLLNKYKLKK